jgi:hypothetical protein
LECYFLWNSVKVPDLRLLALHDFFEFGKVLLFFREALMLSKESIPLFGHGHGGLL